VIKNLVAGLSPKAKFKRQEVLIRCGRKKLGSCVRDWRGLVAATAEPRKARPARETPQFAIYVNPLPSGGNERGSGWGHLRYYADGKQTPTNFLMRSIFKTSSLLGLATRQYIGCRASPESVRAMTKRSKVIWVPGYFAAEGLSAALLRGRAFTCPCLA
jgi:hypothetical protein